MFGDQLTRIRGDLKSLLYSGPRRDRWQLPSEVISALAVEPGQRVADIGAGGGYFTFRLARTVGDRGRIYAVDPDADMRARIDRLATDQGCPNVVTVDPGDKVPLLPEPVDLALMVETFHHLPANRVDYLTGLAGQLRDAGQVAVIEALPRWFLFGHATDPARIRSTFHEAGYSLTAEHDLTRRQSFMVFSPPLP